MSVFTLRPVAVWLARARAVTARAREAAPTLPSFPEVQHGVGRPGVPLSPLRGARETGRFPRPASLRSTALPIAGAAAGAALVIVAAAAGGDLAGRALGAMAVVALFGLGVVALRRARGAPDGERVLSVLERHPIAKDAGVAVLVTQGRRLVVGYGSAGVALLAELGPTEERVP